MAGTGLSAVELGGRPGRVMFTSDGRYNTGIELWGQGLHNAEGAFAAAYRAAFTTSSDPAWIAYRSRWAALRDSAAGVESRFDDLGSELAKTWSITDYTREAKVRWALDAIDSASAPGALIVETTTGLERLTADMRAAVQPRRPASSDPAAAEVRLMGLKADVRMLLDPTRPDDLARRVSEMLADAVASGDEQLVWLLGATSWPKDYLISRGAQDYLTELDVLTGVALDRGDDTRGTLRRFVDEVAGRNGFVRVQGAGSLLLAVLSDLRANGGERLW